MGYALVKQLQIWVCLEIEFSRWVDGLVSIAELVLTRSLGQIDEWTSRNKKLLHICSRLAWKGLIFLGNLYTFKSMLLSSIKFSLLFTKFHQMQTALYIYDQFWLSKQANFEKSRMRAACPFSLVLWFSGSVWFRLFILKIRVECAFEL